MDIKAERERLLDLHEQQRAAPRAAAEAASWKAMELLFDIKRMARPDDRYAGEKFALMEGIFDTRRRERSWEDDHRDLRAALDALADR